MPLLSVGKRLLRPQDLPFCYRAAGLAGRAILHRRTGPPARIPALRAWRPALECAASPSRSVAARDAAALFGLDVLVNWASQRAGWPCLLDATWLRHSVLSTAFGLLSHHPGGRRQSRTSAPAVEAGSQAIASSHIGPASR